MRAVFCFLFLSVVITGCSLIKSSQGTTLDEGVYHSKQLGTVYVQQVQDSIQVIPNKETGVAAPVSVFATEAGDSLNCLLKKTTLDVDLLTVLLKYRPRQDGFPQQLNTNFNGAVYVGYRTDMYRLSYRRTPLSKYRRRVNHYAFSFGAFGGIGATAMNTWVTRGNINAEYDGVVIPKGIAAIVGINNLTVGLSAGTDNLTDANRRYWIYENKLWYGLTVGLNLN